MLSITSIGVTDLNKKVKSLFKAVITQLHIVINAKIELSI